MNILTIAVRNVRRKWVRAALLLLVFTLGVVSIVSLQFVSSVVGEGLEKKLVSFGANILIAPKSEKLTVSYGGFSLGDMLFDVSYLDEKDVVAKIDGIALRKNISVIAPKLVAMERVGGVAVAVVGVRFEEELRLKGYWTAESGQLPGGTPGGGMSGNMSGGVPSGLSAAMDDGMAHPPAAKDKKPAPADFKGPEGPHEGAAVVGSAAAAKLGLTVGHRLPLGRGHLVAVAVLAPTGSEDDNVLLADLGFMQRALGRPGKANFVEVAALCSGCPIEDIVAQLAAALPGVDIKALRSVVEQRMYSVHFVRRLVLSVSLVILLTGCSMVGVSMLSAVNERKKEIGILRSLGFSRRAVFGIFCAEAGLIGLLAGLLGYAGGYAASFRVLQALELAEGASLAFDPLHLTLAGLALALITSVSSLFPAWKAASIEPSEALAAL